MSAGHRPERGLLLAAVALLGFVITPVLHAEEHWREAHADELEADAAAEAWSAQSGDPLAALAYALGHVHDAGQPKPAPGGPHGHSHGPAGSGPHGAGVLSHLGVALHAAPQLPSLESARPPHAAPAAVTAQLRGTLRYLVPEGSQGPPAAC